MMDGARQMDMFSASAARAAGRPRPRRGLGVRARVRVRAGHRRALPGGHTKGAVLKAPAAVPFVVGRLGKGDKRMMVLEAETPPPIPGPWDLRAVFSR